MDVDDGRRRRALGDFTGVVAPHADGAEGAFHRIVDHTAHLRGSLVPPGAAGHVVLAHLGEAGACVVGVPGQLVLLREDGGHLRADAGEHVNLVRHNRISLSFPESCGLSDFLASLDGGLAAGDLGRLGLLGLIDVLGAEVLLDGAEQHDEADAADDAEHDLEAEDARVGHRCPGRR